MSNPELPQQTHEQIVQLNENLRRVGDLLERITWAIEEVARNGRGG